jgi:hypothetical protein
MPNSTLPIAACLDDEGNGASITALSLSRLAAKAKDIQELGRVGQRDRQGGMGILSVIAKT